MVLITIDISFHEPGTSHTYVVANHTPIDRADTSSRAALLKRKRPWRIELRDSESFSHM